MNTITYNGKTYPLSGWLTYPRYAEKHGLPIPTVHQRIKRGNIPAECLLEIPELSLKLIRDEVYAIPPVGAKPKLQEKLTKRYRVIRGGPASGQEPNRWWLIDLTDNQMVIGVEAGNEGEAIEELNKNGYSVNSEGEITGIIL